MRGKDEIIGEIQEIGVIGIARVDSPETCLEIIDSWVNGGLYAVEVTTTTPDAISTIKRVRQKFGDDVLVGIGTVLDRGTAEKGISAGAQFVVSPSLHKEVLDACAENRVISCPGTFTATEIVQASKWGADIIKVFPASQLGPSYIRALLSPLPWAKLVPTGGITIDNAQAFIRAGAFCLGVGAALAPEEAVAKGRFDLLTAAAEKMLKAVKAAKNTMTT
jgi:2-dehydro-3-deoxyphosphogluconate aldolase / (4S)-4-hydroxy-2-oxoglutarate aldolase